MLGHSAFERPAAAGQSAAAPPAALHPAALPPAAVPHPPEADDDGRRRQRVVTRDGETRTIVVRRRFRNRRPKEA